jgi:hypothetical protein
MAAVVPRLIEARVCHRSVTPSRLHHRGGASSADADNIRRGSGWGSVGTDGARPRLAMPTERPPVPGNGDDHLVGVCAAGQQASKAVAQAAWRRPTDVLTRLGELRQPELSVATDCGGLPVGPGAFDQGASGLGVPGGGDRPRSASLPAGRF